MGMAVNAHVNPGGILNDVHGTPSVRNPCLPQMAHQYHIISALIPGRVHACLDLVVKALSALIFTERIDIIARTVLEIRGCGLGKALRRGNAYVGNLRIAVCNHLIGCKNSGACCLIHEVTCIVTAVEPAGQFQEPGHAIVKFMIARNSHVIPHVVHDINQIPSL